MLSEPELDPGVTESTGAVVGARERARNARRDVVNLADIDKTWKQVGLRSLGASGVSRTVSRCVRRFQKRLSLQGGVLTFHSEVF